MLERLLLSAFYVHNHCVPFVSTNVYGRAVIKTRRRVLPSQLTPCRLLFLHPSPVNKCTPYPLKYLCTLNLTKSQKQIYWTKHTPWRKDRVIVQCISLRTWLFSSRPASHVVSRSTSLGENRAWTRDTKVRLRRKMIIWHPIENNLVRISLHIPFRSTNTVLWHRHQRSEIRYICSD